MGVTQRNRSQKIKPKRNEVRMKSSCVHHWHIDSNDYGRCCLCGKEKDFAKLQAKTELVNPYRAYRVKHKKEKAQVKPLEHPDASDVIKRKRKPCMVKRGRGRPKNAVSSSR